MQLRHFHSQKHPGHWLELVEDGDPTRPLIFMVHGAVGSWRNFRYQMEHFRGDHHVVGLDLRGHGQSPWIKDSKLEHFYSDLEEVFLDVTQNRRAVVLAHSFGGCLATQLAARHPERLGGLALLNTAGNIPRNLSYQLLQLFTPLADFVAKPENPITAGSDVCNTLLRGVLREWDCWPLYPQLQVPTLVLLGQMDPLIPLKLGKKTAAAIPGAQLCIVPGGHVSMWEMPQRINQALRDWILTLRSGDGQFTGVVHTSSIQPEPPSSTSTPTCTSDPDTNWHASDRSGTGSARPPVK